MLVYKNGYDIKINPIYQRRYEWDTHFNTYIDIYSDNLQKISLSKYIKDNKIISDKEFVLNKKSLLNEEFRQFAFKNRNKIFQSTKEIPDEAKQKSLNNKDHVIEYSKGEYAFNGRRLSPLSKSIYNIGFDGYFEEDFGKLLCDFWDDVDFNNLQNEGGISFPSGKKPEILLARFITMFTQKKDIVCDFYLGSGTTAAVAHKMGRQYIGVEQIDYGENDSVVRLQNVIKGDKSGISRFIKWGGGGNFIYCELAQANQKFVDQIQAANDSKTLQEIWRKMQEKAFLSYRVDPKAIDTESADFMELSLDDQKRFLIEVLDKNMLYVPLSEMDDETYGISSEDKKMNRLFFNRQ
jgi:adenine-specific DNA-methyltransferase